MSQLVLRALGGVVIGLAAWCSLGVLAIGDGGSPVGLLPPVWLLVLLSLVGAAALLRFRAVPLSTAFLPAVTVAAWVGTVRLPLMFVWSGPFVAIVWALFAVDVARRVRWRLEGIAGARSVVAVIVSIAAAAFAAGALRSTITGDEPHYLLISQSLLLDGDLDLRNDYDVARHRAIYPAPLEPRHTVLAFSGKEYSFHGIGVAALALPGFAVAGLRGAQLSFLLLAITGAVCFWIAARETSGVSSAAWAASAALVFQLPFLAQTAAIYPDGPAAAITSLALVTLVRIERGTRVSLAALIACGAALSLLPWLHLRLTVIAAAFALAIAYAMRRRGRAGGDIIAFLAVPAIAAALFFASTHVMFETFDPTEAFRGKAAGSLASIPTGVTGLLFDHEYGLLVYVPVAAIAIAGWRHLHRVAPITAFASAASAIATLLIGAAFVWWGGTTSPARFLVPVLPAVVLAVAAWWPQASTHARGIGVALTAYGAAVAALAAWTGGRYVTTDPDGRMSIFEWANRSVDLPAAMPSLFRTDTTLGAEFLIAVVWLTSAIVVLRLARRLPAPWLVVGWITVAAAATWFVRGVDPVTSQRSQRALLHPSSFLTTPWVNRRPAASIDAVYRSVAFEGVIDEAPAGRYRVDAANDATTVSIAIGTESIVMTWAAAASDDERTFSLPVAVQQMRVGGGRLRPISFARRDISAAQFAIRSGDALLFVWDTPQREPNGLWVAADRPVRVLCSRLDGVTPCAALQFAAAAADVTVSVESGDSKRMTSVTRAVTGVIELAPTLTPVLIIATGPPSRTRAVFVTAAPGPAAR